MYVALNGITIDAKARTKRGINNQKKPSSSSNPMHFYLSYKDFISCILLQTLKDTAPTANPEGPAPPAWPKVMTSQYLLQIIHISPPLPLLIAALSFLVVNLSPASWHVLISDTQQTSLAWSQNLFWDLPEHMVSTEMPSTVMRHPFFVSSGFTAVPRPLNYIPNIKTKFHLQLNFFSPLEFKKRKLVLISMSLSYSQLASHGYIICLVPGDPSSRRKLQRLSPCSLMAKSRGFIYIRQICIPSGLYPLGEMTFSESLFFLYKMQMIVPTAQSYCED